MGKKLFFWSVIFTVNFFFINFLNAASDPPTISNFRIEASEPDKVFFDSSEPITGSNTKGFVVSNKTISGLSIAENQTSGHYFKISGDFTYWDNNTIRYEGGSDIKDAGGDGLIEFTLSYIVNNIPEPDANDDRYVTTSATGGGDGKSESSAWTLDEAFDKANAGMTVWIKAGNYGNQNLALYNDGTSVSPLKFIGYKNSPGDITKNYYDYGKTWSTSEMPTLTGKSSSDGHAIQLMGANYVIFKNIQIKRYRVGIRANGTKNSNLVFQRINGNTFGDDDTRHASFISLQTINGTTFVSNSNMKALDCRSVNASMAHIVFYGDGSSLIDGCKTYSDRLSSNARSDYAINVNGHNNIIRNCYIENFNNTESNTSTHGIGVRGASNLNNTYNLIEKSTAINFQEGLYIRNYGCDYNVIKDCYVGNNGASSSEDRGGVWIWGGANHNIVERVIVEDVDMGIGFKDNQEEGNTKDTSIGKNNIIRNSIFRNTKYSIYSGGSNNSLLKNNKIINCTFNNSNYFFKNYNTNVQNLEIINCNITNIKKSVATTKYNTTLSGISFKSSNFWNSWGVPSGEGNIKVNPKYESKTSLKLSPDSPKEIREGGLILPEVKFDIQKKIRKGTYSIGAYEYNDETTGTIEVNAGEDVEICAGDSTTLTAIGEGSFEWSTGETTASITVSPGETTTYTVTLTNNGQTASDEVVVTVNEAPEVTLEEDKSICSGTEITLTATGTGDFLWSTGDTTESITVSPTETTTYSVTATTACDTTATDSIVINVTDLVSVDAGEDVTTCSGNEVTLTAVGDGEYLWNTGETTQSITVSPTETTTYSVTLTSGECSATDEVTVSISEDPQVTLGEDKTICSGEEVTLYAQGSGTFLWNTGETAQSIKVSPTETTEYSVTATTKCGDNDIAVSDTIVVNVNELVTLTTSDDVSICGGNPATLTAETDAEVLWSTGATTKSITVNPTETTTYSVTAGTGTCSITEEIIVTVGEAASVALGEDVAICSGSEITLTAEGSGSFLWNTGETTKSITVSPTETTEYSVIATANCNGTDSTASDSIIVNVVETVTLTTSGDTQACAGSPVTLTAESNAPVLWNTGETTKSITVNPAKTTVYSVTAGRGDCSVTEDITVTVGEGAAVSLGEDISICYGEEITLTAAGSGEFLWSTGEISESIIVDPLVTTTYSVTATDGCGNTATDEIVVNVGRELLVDAGEDKTICTGESVTLTAKGNGNFLWNTGEITKSITVSPTKPSYYTVSVIIDGDCSVSDEIFVDVQKAAAVDLGEDVTICSGDVVTLRATGHGDYLWSTGATTSSISVRPTQTTTYYITASSSVCSADATDEITVYVNDGANAYAGEDVEIDEGDTVTLKATGGNKFLWNTGETTSSIAVSPDKTTEYTVTVSNSEGTCTDTDKVSVIVKAIPLTISNGNEITICKDDKVVLQATGSDNYLWDTGEMTSEITVSPTETTTYTVTSQKAGVLETAEIVVKVEDCSGNKVVEYNIFPNPTDGVVNLQLPAYKEAIQIDVFALNGKIVYRGAAKADQSGVFTQLNLSHVSDGIYFIKMYNDEINATSKIVVN